MLVDKNGSDLSNLDSFNQILVKDNLYVLASLNYNTGYEIYNISSPEDFLDKNIIKRDGEKRNYVVTSNLDFRNILSSDVKVITQFNGTIDFQGYSVDVYKDYQRTFKYFSRINQGGSIKNIVLNYHLEHDGVLGTAEGFVGVNYGTIENIITSVEQSDLDSSFTNISLLAETNCGYINNFVIYLNSDLRMYSTSASLGVKHNEVSGDI